MSEHIQALDYDAVGFSSTARKLVASRTTFTFSVGGDARRELEAYLVDGELMDYRRLMVRPHLRALAGTLNLAEAQEMPFRWKVTTLSLDVRIGEGADDSEP